MSQTKREFQIRVTDAADQEVECFCFDDQAQAIKAYTKTLEAFRDGEPDQEYHCELIEVLEQDHIIATNSSDDIDRSSLLH